MTPAVKPQLRALLRRTRAGFRLAFVALDRRRELGWRGLAVHAARRLPGSPAGSGAGSPGMLSGNAVPPPGASFDAIYAIGYWAGEPKRYRVFNIAEGLRAAGYAIHVLPFDRLDDIRRYRWRAAALVLFRAEYDPLAGIEEALDYARASGMRIIYDVDDLVFDPSLADRIDGLRLMGRYQRRRFVAAMARQRRLLLTCDLATVSTAPLARAVAALGRPSAVIPNSLNGEQLRLAAEIAGTGRPLEAVVRIGYFSGTRTHQRDFAECEPAVLAAMEQYPELRFRLVGYLDLGPQWQRYRDRVERIGFLSPADLLRCIGDTDINLAPLERGNPFCEAKSELKFFEAAVVGVPTIASATEPFAAAIEDGINGFVVGDTEGWRRALDLLVTSPGRRRAMGDAARRRALERFSLAAVVPGAAAALGLPPASGRAVTPADPAAPMLVTLTKSGQEPVGERFVDLLRWGRIPGGLRYVRRYGLSETLRRVLPRLRTYPAWVKIYDTLAADDIAAIETHIGEMADRPLISLLMPVAAADEPLLRRAIDGVAAQLYPEWELCLGAEPAAMDWAAKTAGICGLGVGRIKVARAEPGGGFAGAVNAALSTATGGLVALVRVEDELAHHALYRLAVELERHPDADILYSDEDEIDTRGRRHNPLFKTDWNPDLALGHDMIGRLAAYRGGLVERIGGVRTGFEGAEEFDLALRASVETTPDRIRHIPTILYHRRARIAAEGAQQAAESRCHAVSEQLTRMGAAAEVTALPGNRLRVRYALPAPAPGVSLIVPTRDQVDVLRRCVDGLLCHTDYDNIELIIVDNHSERPETHAYFADIARGSRVRILQYPGPFNYAAINNFAVARAGFGIIGLINNDIEVIHGDWLREMVSHVVRPGVGAVGAKLYYPNERIQHAGTIVGLGGAAGHAFRHFARAEPGYAGRLQLVQNLSAVTAACMLVRREVFDEVGGFDEVNLAVAFNDVDLCLRIRERGYRVVWTPFAELYHWESVSRGADSAPEQVERFRREIAYLTKRWRDVISQDPYYSPNLTIHGEDFSLAFPPRVVQPWHQHRGSVRKPMLRWRAARIRQEAAAGQARLRRG